MNFKKAMVGIVLVGLCVSLVLVGAAYLLHLKIINTKPDPADYDLVMSSEIELDTDWSLVAITGDDFIMRNAIDYFIAYYEKEYSIAPVIKNGVLVDSDKYGRYIYLLTADINTEPEEVYTSEINIDEAGTSETGTDEDDLVYSYIYLYDVDGTKYATDDKYSVRLLKNFDERDKALEELKENIRFGRSFDGGVSVPYPSDIEVSETTHLECDTYAVDITAFGIESVHDLSGMEDETEILIDVAYNCTVEKSEGFTEINIVADCFTEDGDLIATLPVQEGQAPAEGEGGQAPEDGDAAKDGDAAEEEPQIVETWRVPMQTRSIIFRLGDGTE